MKSGKYFRIVLSVLAGLALGSVAVVAIQGGAASVNADTDSR